MNFKEFDELATKIVNDFKTLLSITVDDFEDTEKYAIMGRMQVFLIELTAVQNTANKKSGA